MKTVVGWVSDPYLHVVLAGMVLVGLAMRPAAEELPEAIEYVEVPAAHEARYRLVPTDGDVQPPIVADNQASDRGR